jgi:hypothetical protein
MQPLDLSKQPPRSPRVKIGGIVMLARTIDKMRAALPGGNMGPYKVPGFSTRMLEAIGMSEEDLQAEVARAGSEDEVLAWVLARTDPAKFDEFNRRLAARSVKDIDPDRLEQFRSNYPHHAEVPSGLMLDIIEHDDAKMFGAART